MNCIGCGLRAHATAELDGIEAAFCCAHAPFGYAKVKMFVVC